MKNIYTKRMSIFVLILFAFCLSSCGAYGMKTKDIDDYNFIVFKINDEYFEAVGKCNQVYLKQGAEYPNMNNGEFAVVNADVEICEGGEAGYTCNPFIKKMNAYEIISPEYALKQFDIPEITKTVCSDNQIIFMYRSDNDIFCVFFYKGEYWVYMNGNYMGKYDNLIAQFLDSLKQE